jgi:hypothetical protein
MIVTATELADDNKSVLDSDSDRLKDSIKLLRPSENPPA